jgi:hypothetical protein
MEMRIWYIKIATASLLHVHFHSSVKVSTGGQQVPGDLYSLIANYLSTCKEIRILTKICNSFRSEGSSPHA